MTRGHPCDCDHPEALHVVADPEKKIKAGCLCVKRYPGGRIVRCSCTGFVEKRAVDG